LVGGENARKTSPAAAVVMGFIVGDQRRKYAITTDVRLTPHLTSATHSPDYRIPPLPSIPYPLPLSSYILIIHLVLFVEKRLHGSFNRFGDLIDELRFDNRFQVVFEDFGEVVL